VNDVRATRFQKPNGDGCGSECLFYEVTATFRGKFFSGLKGGFGMDKCCHLLVIEKVVSISSQRTTVPAGGEFQCTSDRWQPTEEERKALSAIPGCSLRDNFDKCYPALAKHWGETIKPMGERSYSGPWMSADMTLFYKFAGGFITKKAGEPSEMTPSSSVIRDVCRVLSPPKPPSERVDCDFYRSGGREDKEAAIALQKRLAGGSETWRSSDMAQVGWLAFEDSIRGWKLPSPAPVRLTKCEPWPPAAGNKEQWGYCTWLSADDLREVTVEFHKADYLGSQLDKVPWVATEVKANFCR